MKYNPNPATSADFYKMCHKSMYHPGMTKLYSYHTCRNDSHADMLKASPYYKKEITFFGLQAVLSDLQTQFQDEFFDLPKHVVVKKYKERMDSSLGKDMINTDHIGALHDLGYLPLEVKALDEGTVVPLQTPLITITNTHDDFAWLVNYVESNLLSNIWHPITVATVAHEYKKIMTHFAEETSDNVGFVDFQGHDFSFRGQNGSYAAMIAGAAFLTSFKGTDTIQALDLLEHYYGVDPEKEAAGFSVRASEHSIMTSLILYKQHQIESGKICRQANDNSDLEEAEYLVFKDLLEKFPDGILSLVSDQFDYWNVISKHLPRLKPIIMARNGKLVIRPDSGDPVKVICGYKESYLHENKIYSRREELSFYRGNYHYYNEISLAEQKGTIRCLYETFGGTINSKGYIELDSHIGVILGDGLTIPRVITNFTELKEMGFASTNLICGIGAYSLNGNLTRDTFGQAFKAVSCTIDGVQIEVYKDPKTDPGKKSAKGLLKVYNAGSRNEIVFKDQCTVEEEKEGLLKTVFKDGKLINQTNLYEIRNRLNSSI